MHDLYTCGAELARQRLRQLPHGGASGAVRGELRVATQSAERACEDQGALLGAAFAERRGAVVGLEAFDGFLGECECAAD
jgi:hypothetical protein